jgi:hypothetical protein
MDHIGVRDPDPPPNGAIVITVRARLPRGRASRDPVETRFPSSVATAQRLRG